MSRAEQEQKTVAGPEGGAAGEGITLKYNGGERVLPLEEVVVLAQKGLNYDKMKERAEAGGGEEGRVLDTLAQQLDIDREEAAEMLEEMCAALVEQELAGRGAPPEVAARMAQEGLTAGGGFGDGYDEGPGSFLALAEKYPDLEELPDEMCALMEEGVPPLYAYEMCENSRLRESMSAMAAAEKNRERTAGSAASTEAAAAADPFLRGWNRAGGRG